MHAWLLFCSQRQNTENGGLAPPRKVRLEVRANTGQLLKPLAKVNEEVLTLVRHDPGTAAQSEYPTRDYHEAPLDNAWYGPRDRHFWKGFMYNIQLRP